jgi:hypothetical protein
VDENGADTYQAMTYGEARTRLWLPTLEIERRVRQLKWMQNMMEGPGNHAHELAALYGTAKLDEQSTLEDRRLGENANPWANSCFTEAVFSVAYGQERGWMGQKMEGNIAKLWDAASVVNHYKSSMCGIKLPYIGDRAETADSAIPLT